MDLPQLMLRQPDILDFFQSYVRAHHISPTLEEIAQSLGVNRVTVFGHVAELERKGVLTKSARAVSGALEISPAALSQETARSSPVVQILGRIAAGAPIEAVEHPE